MSDDFERKVFYDFLQQKGLTEEFKKFRSESAMAELIRLTEEIGGYDDVITEGDR